MKRVHECTSNAFNHLLCLLRPLPYRLLRFRSLSLPSILDIGCLVTASNCEENSYLRHRAPLEPLQKVMTKTISEKTFLKSRTILRRCFVRSFGVGCCTRMCGQTGNGTNERSERRTAGWKIGQTKRTLPVRSTYSQKIRSKRCVILIPLRSFCSPFSAHLLSPPLSPCLLRALESCIERRKSLFSADFASYRSHP